MPERLRVQYSHKFSQKLGDDYDTAALGAEWEFDIPDGADVQNEYGNAYAVLRTMVDGFLESKPAPVAARPAALPGERLSGAGSEAPREDRPKGTGQIIEGQEYEFSNARVWAVDEGRTQRGKQYAKVRVGNKEQIPGTGYANVKTYNPYMISKLLALREGDHIDVRGKFEGWDGREGRMYDFVPIEVERVRDVRSD